MVPDLAMGKMTISHLTVHFPSRHLVHRTPPIVEADQLNAPLRRVLQRDWRDVLQRVQGRADHGHPADPGQGQGEGGVHGTDAALGVPPPVAQEERGEAGRGRVAERVSLEVPVADVFATHGDVCNSVSRWRLFSRRRLFRWRFLDRDSLDGDFLCRDFVDLWRFSGRRLFSR